MFINTSQVGPDSEDVIFIFTKNSLIFLRGDDASSTNSSSSSGGDKTDLATSWRVSLNRGSLTNMLVVTSTVRMFNGVHANTTHLRPAVSLRLVLEVRTTGLQDGLFDPATSCDDADHSSVSRGNNFLRAGRQLDTSLLCVRIVGDDDGVIAGCTGESASITGLLLEVAYSRSFRHVADWEDIANLKNEIMDKLLSD